MKTQKKRTKQIESLEERLSLGLTESQKGAMLHTHGPLLIIAGAGTGKTTVITRRIAWLISTNQASPEEILALTFTEKAAAEMQERVDVLLPYGYADMWVMTFHAFGDRLLREHFLEAGVNPHMKVLSKAEQAVFLKENVFKLSLDKFCPDNDPYKYVEALATVMARAKDEAVSPEEFSKFADDISSEALNDPSNEHLSKKASEVREVSDCYAAYQKLLLQEGYSDFGNLILLAIKLLEENPFILENYRKRFRYILVDEFQDTNYAQFRLLQLLAGLGANVTVVADDDQSIYKWRGAAISNVLKFLDYYKDTRRIVLTDNFRSSQAILDCAYRLIRFNDPDRLEVTEAINKRLLARCDRKPLEPKLMVFDTYSSEADWVASHIQRGVASGNRKPGDFAILVRTNREADMFLRALNVCGIPWQFSGASGLFGKDEIKVLVSCLKSLADPFDSLSVYHVLSSSLYNCPMKDLIQCCAYARYNNLHLRDVLRDSISGALDVPQASVKAAKIIKSFLSDSDRLLELSRNFSPGQILYRWLSDTGWLRRHADPDSAAEFERLQIVARFFDHLYHFESLSASKLPELIESFDFFKAIGDAPDEEGFSFSDESVNVLTIHKAKGLEFPVVFMVGLIHGRFPSPVRRDPIELPEQLIKDILPSGDYHLQEERRLFFVGMTRAKEELYLSAAYDYGGKSLRKISQFVLEALNISSPNPPARKTSTKELLDRARPPMQESKKETYLTLPEPLKLDPHGVDDYLTCPLKFRYSHLARVPIMRHHLVVYGSALHKAIEAFFKRILQGKTMSEEELIEAFESSWSSEGFLTKEHEHSRHNRAIESLRRFYSKQKESPEKPTMIEEKFTFQVEDVFVSGRWDRVDCTREGVVIIDYKSSDISDQKEADERAKDSMQMQIYALAWQSIKNELPIRLELRFLDSGLTGVTFPTDKTINKAKGHIQKAAEGMRLKDFRARPQEHSCRWCAYQSICPFASL